MIRFLFSMVFPLLLVPMGYGGTGVGSSFIHKDNIPFDFHMAYPDYWQLELQARTSATERWYLSNLGTADPGSESWIDVGFYSNFPADNLTELHQRILEREDTGIDWSPLEGSFVGWTSGDVDSDKETTRIIDYFLVERRLVIRIERYTVPNADGPGDMIRIVNSIDRASSGPRVHFVRTESVRPYRVGDNACYLIEVDDLKGSFQKDSLTRFSVRGQQPHWAFSEIEWVPERNWFRICVRVNLSYDVDGTQLESFALINERAQLVLCRSAQDPSQVECIAVSGEGEPDIYRIPASIAPVINTRVDRSGPTVTALHFDAREQSLVLSVEDVSGVQSGEVFASVDSARISDMEGALSWKIYPDQLRQGLPVRLAHGRLKAWVTLERILLLDKNGNPTLLRVPISEEFCSERELQPHRYQIIDAQGRCTVSDFPIITFLSQ